METIIQAIEAAGLSKKEYSDLIDKITKLRREVIDKEQKELYAKIVGHSKEVNLLKKPIYTHSDISELTGASITVVRRAIKQAEDNQE